MQLLLYRQLFKYDYLFFCFYFLYIWFIWLELFANLKIKE